VLRANIKNTGERVVVIEFASRWEEAVPLRVLEYRCRHLIREALPVLSIVILLMPSNRAVNFYKDQEVDFRFRLVKLYELDARNFLDLPECLLGFIPLMENGAECMEEAEKRIYESRLPRSARADILTGMAILGGLKFRDLPRLLIEKRRDIMIESHAYEIIRNEGYAEGIEKGMQQGIQQGMQQGIQQGLRQGVHQGLLTAIKLGLELKFGTEGLKLFPEIKKIEDTDMLEVLSEAIKVVNSLDEFRNIYVQG
jgi:predicted transposase YdaD